MTAEALTITELTGSQRSIVLRDRVLPYRPVAWGGAHERVKTWYAGNPVATIQMLGPRERETEIRGTWKTRYIAADGARMVSLWGFDDLADSDDGITAEILVAAFKRLRVAGNLLRVSWGPEVRRGVLAEFTPNWQRPEDVEWSALFDWTQIGDVDAPRAADVSQPSVDLEAEMAALDDVASRLPPIIIPNVTTALIAAEEAVRIAAVTLAGQVAAVAGVPEIGSEQFRGIAATVDALVTEGAALRALVEDGGLEFLIPTDGAVDVLGVGAWRGDLSAAVLALLVAAIAAREGVRGRLVDDFLAVVVLRGGQTLRTLARDYYGDAGAWILIADANGFTISNPPVGTILVIPRRGGAGVGASV